MKKLPDDPRFRHVDLKHTDLRKTFARVRREQREAKQRESEAVAEQRAKVREIVWPKVKP